MDMVPRFNRVTSIAEVLKRLLATDGTASHSYCANAVSRKPGGFVRNAVDFADAVHHLSLLHGQMPGVIDHAANHIVDNAARSWLLKAVDGFGRERLYLGRLVVAVGPMPSTAGQQQMTTIVAQQCRALEMLAQSDRRGCALGASMALVMDWSAIRAILDAGAARLGLEPPNMQLPDHAETIATLDAVEQEFPIGRAAQFGATQLLGQHRGVWDLLQARSEVRHSTSR